MQIIHTVAFVFSLHLYHNLVFRMNRLSQRFDMKNQCKLWVLIINLKKEFVNVQ